MNVETLPEIRKYQELIHQHIEFIEKQCFKAVRMKRTAISPRQDIELENDALELSGRVMDTLSENNFRVLRQFKHKSKLTTYLTTIIANQAVDMIRRKKGRNREKERAGEYGNMGLQVYQKTVVQGLSNERAYQELKNDGRPSLSESEFLEIASRISGSARNPGNIPNPDDNLIRMGSQDSQTGEIISPDNLSNPEDTSIRKDREQHMDQLLRDTINELNGEDKLIISMRFPANPDQEAERIDSIAAALGISSKAVYKRISRILKKCRQHIEKRGLNIHDIL
jgi:RNA polymerase sigma factor (sigma-70 family)